MNNIRILTYNGLDGACAAAALLLRYPQAQLTVTSARRITLNLCDIIENGTSPPARIYVCGVGVKSGWEELKMRCKDLENCGTELFWFCGRGYLDRYRKHFNDICTPIFTKAGSNTGTVCSHLGIDRDKRARALTDLSLLDPHIEGSLENPYCREDQKFWIDLVEAAISQYFKYQDPETYKRVIRHLSSGKATDSDRMLVKIYRRHGGEHALRGKSLKMCRLRERIRLIADADEHVLVTGESGAGKEYVARLIHEAGKRTMEPIITVNCAVFAGNEGLANSVLFGHVKGAFTGAREAREGAFIAADGGVLFLDELGTMPIEVQGKFLRVIEDGWVTPVGADRPQSQVDVRVIAATNRNLPRMMREGDFMEDLFHRLDILRIRLPSLNEHREDIAYIAEHLLRNLNEQSSHSGLSNEDKAALESYDWPGNVRQLRKVIKRAKLLKRPIKEVLSEEKEFLEVKPNGAGKNMLPSNPHEIEDLRGIQRNYVKQAYQINGGNLADTSRRLKISPNTLKKYLRD